MPCPECENGFITIAEAVPEIPTVITTYSCPKCGFEKTFTGGGIYRAISLGPGLDFHGCPACLVKFLNDNFMPLEKVEKVYTVDRSGPPEIDPGDISEELRSIIKEANTPIEGTYDWCADNIMVRAQRERDGETR